MSCVVSVPEDFIIPLQKVQTLVKCRLILISSGFSKYPFTGFLNEMFLEKLENKF